METSDRALASERIIWNLVQKFETTVSNVKLPCRGRSKQNIANIRQSVTEESHTSIRLQS